MSNGLNLGLRLATSLTISPQVQQSLTLLQAPTVELQTLIRKELEQNPVLEEVEREEPEASSDDDAEFLKEFEQLAALDEGWGTPTHRVSASTEDEEAHQFTLDCITGPTSLQADLLNQVHGLDLSPSQMRIGEEIVGSVNDAGFLEATVEDVARQTSASQEEVVDVVARLQALEPPGILARDLQESLLLQMERRGRAGTLAHQIVLRGMKDLTRHRIAQLARQFNVYPDEIQDAIEEIGALNPQPGHSLASGDTQFIKADMFVTRVDGGYEVTADQNDVPHLRISRLYRDIMAQPNQSKEVISYIKERVRSGKYLIKCLHLRHDTILKIARVIVEEQREFLERGHAALKPMKMETVALKVGVHETTVSRTVNGKYIQTPQGLFELRYFFSTGVRTQEGGKVSNTGVQKMVADLIAGEDKTRPLSDDAIKEHLVGQGIRISRRTITKYRENLGILASHFRRSA